MTREELEMMVKEMCGDNAEYVLAEYDIQHEFEWLNRSSEEMKDFHMERLVELVKRFHERRLTPATAKVGDGASVRYWSDIEAGTIVKVTKSTITIQRDKATLDPNFKPEWIPGGFAGHCTNQDEQTYTYERDPNGKLTTLRWSKKYNQYGQPNDLRAIKGRHEFYDYNF